MLLTRNTGTKFPALKEQEICDLGCLGSLIVTTGTRIQGGKHNDAVFRALSF